MRPRGLTGVLAALALLLLLPRAAPGGDPEVAKLLFDKGEKALRTGNLEEAEEFYRRAVAEHSPYPEAWLGLGKTLEKANRTDEAIASYLKCRDEVRALPAATPAQKRAAGEADRAVGRLGKGYAELAEIDAFLFKRAMELGRQSQASDPDWARKFFSAALLVKPDDPIALGLLGKLAEDPASAGAMEGFELQTTPDGMAAWFPGLAPPWTLSDGILSVDARTGSCVNFQRGRKSERFAIRASFRLREDVGASRSFGVLFGRKPPPSATIHGLLLTRGGELALVSLGKTGGSGDLRARTVPRFRWDQWHTIEARIEGATVKCFLDGDSLFDHRVAQAVDLEGSVGLMVQQACVDIRDVGVTP